MHLSKKPLQGSILFYHFLVMAVALLRISGFHLLTHHHVDAQVFLLSEGEFEQMCVILQKIIVSFILFHTPIIACINSAIMPMMPIFPFILPLRDNIFA